MQIRIREKSFIVEGSGPFPFDMLRYDQCFPSSQADSAMLQHHERGKRRVGLVMRAWSQSPTPTVDRWRSFGWDVVSAE